MEVSILGLLDGGLKFWAKKELGQSDPVSILGLLDGGLKDMLALPRPTTS